MQSVRMSLLAFLLCTVAGASLRASEPLQLDFSATTLHLGIQEAGPSEAEPAPPVPAEAVTASPGYARQGSVNWWFELGAGTDFNQGWEASGGVGVEWYPIDGFSLGVRADGIGIGLEDTSATAGGGVALLVRWHVIQREDWSLYVDGGCGLAYFSSRVPTGAAHLNFTPQVGIGASFAIEDDLRLLAGLRWFHVSNGQTASSNPGVDMLAGYVGFAVPF